MLFRLKYIFLFIIFIGVSNKIDAQFKGGNANGGDSQTLTQSICVAPENQNIYFGGNANGASIISLSQTACSLPENGNIYFGGNANGSSIQRLIGSICTPPENLSIFFGGSGGKATQSLTLCTPPESTSIFYGGIANGASSQYFINCPSGSATPVGVFFGGNSDGYAFNKLSQSACLVIENTNVFFGGNSDGFFNKSLIQSACVSENLNIFFGGNTSGFVKNSLVQTVCSPAENQSIFLGGSADGYSLKSLLQTSCPLPENYNIFFGGDAEGYAILNLTQSICAVPENNYIFQGGDADGYSTGNLFQTICPIPENFDIFLGGNTDGYAVKKLAQTICSTPENLNFFIGGNADGYNVNRLVQTVCPVSENYNISFGGIANGESFQRIVSCTPPEIASIYFGGIANGASSSYITMCPPGLYTVNIYSGGSANGASSQSIKQTICTTPENRNIYFGGNANGVSNSRVTQTVCMPPENLNIYLGGSANGSSNSKILQSVCIPPENLNIYLGGNTNGSSNRTIKPSVCAASENWSIFFGGKADGYAYRSLIQPYFWTGAIDHNWHNPLNWSLEAVPDINSLAIITNVPNYPIISVATATTKSIVIQSGARLDVNNKDFSSEFNVVNDGTINITGNPIITIGGNLNSENGTFNSGNSKTIFNTLNGVQTININSGNLYDVEIRTAIGASCKLTCSITIRNNLNITSGSFDASTYNLSIGGNWNNLGAFIPGTSTVLLNGLNQTISKTTGENFYNLLLTNNTHIILNDNISISNNLTFTSGVITTGVNRISLGTGIATPGSLTYTSGRIIGRMERWIASIGTFIIPLGTSDNMETISLTVNSGLTAGSVVAYFLSNNSGNSGLPIIESGVSIMNQFTEGYWNLTGSNGLVVNDYSISLAANGFVSYTLNNDARILKRTNGGFWTLEGSHVDASNPNCYRNNLTGGISALGTQFTIGAADCYGGQIASNQSICSGFAAAPFTNIFSAKVGSTYTWQYTEHASAVPGDSNWTDIPLSDLSGFTYPLSLSKSTWFVRRASTSCGIRYSNVITVTVIPAPVTGPFYHIPNSFGY